MRYVLGLLFSFFLLLSGCVGDLTPKQHAYDVLAKFNSAQVFAERAVFSPSVPVDAKDEIKRLEAAAFRAVTGYTDAIYRGETNLSAYYAAAVGATGELVRYLIERGVMSRNESSIPTAGQIVVGWLHYSGKGV